MTVRIVSYNLLVPIYAEQSGYYNKCQPIFLKTDHRLHLIEKYLEQEIIDHENTIICLQELSLLMLPKLELFFRRLNYSFFHNLYGGRWDNYMGVGVAVPISMQVNDISYIKMGDYIRTFCKTRENTTSMDHDGSNEPIEVPSDSWDTAMGRWNTLVCLQLVINGKSLCVGTYHMPCYYKEPSVMAIHSSVLKDLMFQLAAGKNLIIAGDFNIEPKDKSYRALTEKGYLNVHFPKSDNYDISYQPNTEQVWKSAYREKNGSEPVYTNFAYTSNSGRYCATLDYIFFAGQFTVESVLELPRRPIGESYPDETHPSDHLLIAATFRLS